MGQSYPVKDQKPKPSVFMSGRLSDTKFFVHELIPITWLSLLFEGYLMVLEDVLIHVALDDLGVDRTSLHVVLNLICQCKSRHEVVLSDIAWILRLVGYELLKVCELGIEANRSSSLVILHTALPRLEYTPIKHFLRCQSSNLVLALTCFRQHLLSIHILTCGLKHGSNSYQKAIRALEYRLGALTLPYHYANTELS